MSRRKQAAQGSAAVPEAALTFGSMSPLQKLAHISKVCVFFLTLGFAYPNILGE